MFEPTEKTVKYIEALLDERDIDQSKWSVRLKEIRSAIRYANEHALGLNETLISCDYLPLTIEGKNQVINHLQNLPKKSEQDKNQLVEAGMYKLGDTIYKVQKAVHGSGNLYAKKLVVDSYTVLDNPDEYFNIHFEYAPGAIRQLSLENKMSLEEAKAFGALYGTCCVCGRTLTDEESIKNGIGPVCANKF